MIVRFHIPNTISRKVRKRFAQSTTKNTTDNLVILRSLRAVSLRALRERAVGISLRTII